MREFMGGTVEGHMNLQRFSETVSRIVTENNQGSKITYTAVWKDGAPGEDSKEELPAAV